MSLVALALRIATVKALTGKTFAGERVFDSAIDDLDVQAEEEKAPFLVVYTDEEEITLSGKDLSAGKRDLSLVIHVVVASAVQAEGGETMIEVPQTDEGLETILDLIRFDVLRELQSFGGEWGDLWRDLVMSVSKVSQRRGASSKNGVRFAAREITINLEPISDPFAYMQKVGTWERLDHLFRQDAELKQLAELIDVRFSEEPPSIADQLRACLGLSKAAASALSFVDDAGNPVVFQ